VSEILGKKDYGQPRGKNKRPGFEGLIAAQRGLANQEALKKSKKGGRAGELMVKNGA